jgi:cephalosporin hydroxylase
MHLEDALERNTREVLACLQERITMDTTYFGIRTLKNPGDVWVYREIMHACRPDVVIEIGVYQGGSTLMLAHTCDLLDHGRVIGIDVSLGLVDERARRHPRITFLEADAGEAFRQVDRLVPPGSRVLVIEDSSHTYENTLGVLRQYSRLLQTGDYFIVEDSICWHGLDLGPRPGPHEAIEQFIRENRAFAIDRTCEKYIITWNPNGFLRKTGKGASAEPEAGRA